MMFAVTVLGAVKNGCLLCRHLYRNLFRLDGVLLAIGKVVVDKPLCIADQLCMHIDLTVNSVVFRPEKDHIYKCLVTAADKVYYTASLSLKCKLSAKLNFRL